MKLTEVLSQAAHNCLHRFPVPTVFVTALTVYGIYNILAEQKPDELMAAIGYFLSVGFVLSLSLTLWSEEHRWTVKDTAVHSIAYLVLLADAIYLYHINFGTGGRGYETFLMHASAILALVLTVFFLSFQHERNDIPSWNFALDLITSFIICIAIGLILWGGLSILFSSMDWLFKVHLGWKWYAVTGVLFAGCLPLLLFLGRIPEGEVKHDREPLHSGFLAGVFRYLFLPLEALYIVVLLIYAVQILVRWELPNGQVSWLVIASMVGLIAIEFGLYPTRHADDRPFDHAVARWLPLILTPLLLLMTIGIVRRFSDYGITMPRLYLATLNVWFYVVCIGLFLTRAHRIHWIPISFAALFLLTSALPVNYTNLTRRTLLHQVERALTQAGGKTLPLNAKSYDSLMKSLSAQEASRISSKLKYLEQTFNSKTIEPLVTQKGEPIYFKSYILLPGAEGDVKYPDENISYYNSATLNQLHIPEGYTELYANVHCDNFPFDINRDTIEVPVSNEVVTDTLIVSLHMLKGYSKQMDNLVDIPTKSGSNRYLLEQFLIFLGKNADKPTIDLHGYLLTRGEE